MIAEVGSGQVPFRSSYAAAVERHLRDPGEPSLRLAYELGREAVRSRLSILDLAVAYQDALASALGGASTALESERVARLVGEFLVESLSAFEMAQRALGDVHDAVELGRRQIEMSRSLAAFLADAPPARGLGALDEILQLAVEHARELIGVRCCLATVAADGQPRVAEGTSCSPDDERWARFLRWLDLAAVYGQIRTRGGSARIEGEELARLPGFSAVPGGSSAQGWLAASLTAIDGAELGAIQLFGKEKGAFTADDEANLLHLAQTLSAAVERARLER